MSDQMAREFVLIALGGNALSKTGKDSFAKQLVQSKAIAKAISQASKDYSLVLTHGNGPQVGNHLIRNEIAKNEVMPLPLDACVADTQGEIGYMLQQAVSNEMKKIDPGMEVATVVTQVLVDAKDPAFHNPTKPVGPFLSKEEVYGLKRKGYSFSEDPKGRGFRRTVPSPKPIHIIELETINCLIQRGVTAIACGGGGIPVVKSGGFCVGIEAVIDKDLSSSLLARELNVSKFVILTDVEYAFVDFNKPSQKMLNEISITQAKNYLQEGQFPAGSMGPKIQAAVEFTKATKKDSVIGSVDKLSDVLKGESGTRICY